MRLRQRLRDFNIKDLLVFENLDIAPGHEVCEIGVGSGSTCAALAGRCRWVTGMDISGPLIERLGRLQCSDGPANITFMESDITDIRTSSTAAKRYDRIVSLDTLEHVGDAHAFFRGVFSLLGDKGLALVVFPNESLERMHGVTSFATRAELEGAIRAAGFSDFSVSEVRLSQPAGFIVKVMARFPLKILRAMRGGPRGPKPQVFDQTWFFRSSRRPTFMGTAMNLYSGLVMRLASLGKPVFRVDGCGPGSEIVDKRLMLRLRKG